MRPTLLAGLSLAGAIFHLPAVAGHGRVSSPVNSRDGIVPGKVFDRFVTIWLENTDYDKAIGDPNLALLAKQGITLSKQYALTHPSQPNYVASIGGDYFGISTDNDYDIPSNVTTVVDLLEARGISWAFYQENLPYTGFTGHEYVNQKTGANDYVRKHNPAVSYQSVTKNHSRLANIKNFTLFHADVAANALPQWMFITPNMTNDGHDTSVTTAGTFVHNFLTPLLSNANFTSPRTLVLLTFDESHNYILPNHILGLLLGSSSVIPPSKHGSVDSAYYNHYSALATVEANWGLPTLGRHDVGANVWSLVANVTGDVVRAWGDSPPFWTMLFNIPYKGPLARVLKAPWPVPNANIAVRGRKVLPSIQATWGTEMVVGEQTPYDGRLEIPDGLHPPRYG